MRDTDRKRVSEALRLSNGAWEVIADRDRHVLTRRPHLNEHLVIHYGSAGQIIKVNHYFPGIRNGLITKKRERVLAIIEGKR